MKKIAKVTMLTTISVMPAASSRRRMNTNTMPGLPGAGTSGGGPPDAPAPERPSPALRDTRHGPTGLLAVAQAQGLEVDHRERLVHVRVGQARVAVVQRLLE